LGWKGPLEGIWSTLPFSYPCNHKTQAQDHDVVLLPEVLSFETLTPKMCFSGVLYEIPQEEQLENSPTSEEKSKT